MIRALRSTLVRLWPGLLVLWCAGVFLLFFRSSSLLVGSCLGSLGTAALLAATAGAFWMTGWRVGRRVIRGWADEADPLERSVIELGLGALVFIGVWIVLGAAGLFRPWAAWTLLAAALIAPRREILKDICGRLSILREMRGSPTLAVILLLAGAMTLVESLAPVASQDALVYHLAVPAQYVEAGGFTRVEGSFFAFFPQNIEMLFTMGLLLKDETLAQGYHWLLGAAASAAVAALARRLHPKASTLLAAAAFATIPTVALIAGWAYVDLGVVFFATLSILCFLRWAGNEERRWLVLSAAFAGAAAGSKYTAGFQGLCVVAGVLLSGVLRRWPAGRTASLSALAAGVTGAVACPWWIRNVLATGNPLYPFCHALFGGTGWDAERANVLSLALGQWGGERGLVETILLPLRLTFSGQFFSEANFDGVIGCVFLLAAPFLVAGLRLSRGHRAVACFALAHAAFWVLTTRQVRFLLPALAPAAALLGASVPVLVPAGWPRACAAAAFNASLAINVLIASLHFAHHNPMKVVLGLETRSAYLQREIPGGDYSVFEHIEGSLPPDSFILLGSLGNPGFLVKRRYRSDAFFENRTLAAILAAAATPDAAHAGLRARGFTHLLFRVENVFDPTGKRSEIPLEDQKKLAAALNRHAKLVCQAGGTLLYELEAGR